MCCTGAYIERILFAPDLLSHILRTAFAIFVTTTPSRPAPFPCTRRKELTFACNKRQRCGMYCKLPACCANLDTPPQVTYNEDAIAKQLGLADIGGEGRGRRERGEGGSKRGKAAGAVEVVLTEEQAAEREAMIEEMKKRWGRRGEGGREGGWRWRFWKGRWGRCTAGSADERGRRRWSVVGGRAYLFVGRACKGVACVTSCLRTP